MLLAVGGQRLNRQVGPNQFWLSPSTQPYVNSQFWSNPSTQPYTHNFNQAQIHSHIRMMAMRMHAQHPPTWDQIKEVGKLAPMPWHAPGPWIMQRANFQAVKMVQVELPREWFAWREMAIGMMFLWSPQWRVEICSKIQITSQTWVCLSHHYGVICIALHNLEKEAKQGSYK